LGVELASAIERLYPDRINLDATTGMIGARWIVRSLHDGWDPRQIAARWAVSLDAFRSLRQRYLLY
jgi:exo-beta-N-acetylmuramidase NamZ-like protein